MKKFFRPQAFLFYFLTLLTFVPLGSIIASAAGAGENQGLASAAIVIGYGVMTGFIAFISAVFTINFINEDKVKVLNKVLAVILFMIIVFLFFRYKSRKTVSTNFSDLKYQYAEVTAAETIFPEGKIIENSNSMGLGMCKSCFYQDTVIYFYSNAESGNLDNYSEPFDSLVFSENATGIEIIYAPPWFMPAHLKLDYEILYLRILSVNSKLVEIIVNETNGQSAYIDRTKGEIIYWPDFLLNVSSVEQLNPKDNPVRIKPLSHAALVSYQFTFLRPFRISNQWMQVELLNSQFQSEGKGWIKWEECGKLLIKYSLLS